MMHGNATKRLCMRQACIDLVKIDISLKNAKLVFWPEGMQRGTRSGFPLPRCTTVHILREAQNRVISLILFILPDLLLKLS